MLESVIGTPSKNSFIVYKSQLDSVTSFWQVSNNKPIELH